MEDKDTFFDEPKKAEANSVQPAPAPAQGGGNAAVRRKIRWGKLFARIGLGLAIFFLGYFVCWATLDPEIRTLMSVKKKIQKEYYQEVTDEEFYAAIFGGINEDLLDPYSEYMTSEQFAAAIQDLEGNRSGLGLVFDGLRITRVCGNSPAEAAGFKAGEKVIACGKTAENLSTCADFQAFSDMVDSYGEEEGFCVKVEGKDGERVVDVYKTVYVENYVFYRTKEASYAFTGENALLMTQKGAPMSALNAETAYIRLVQFTGNAADCFAQCMEKFKADGKKHLIVDLRGNGGGYLDTMQSIASYFCKTATESKPIAAVADYGNRRVAYRAAGNVYENYFAEDSRICVLADKDSASASECLIGCMLDYGAISYQDICLAERGGVAKTYGKGIMQETFLIHMLEQDALKLTTAEIRWPTSNRSIHGRGVLPDDGALTVEENYDFETETAAAIAKLGL